MLSADEEATLEELEERIEACRTQLEYKVSEVKELYIRGRLFFVYILHFPFGHSSMVWFCMSGTTC